MRYFPSVLPFMAVMAAVVVASNFLVQFPVDLTLGALNLADLLTWGAFTYPVAFLVTDLANRRFGASAARMVVFCGFVIAVVLSIWLATPRIAVASGTAFLMAQLLDVAIFDRLRNKVWWLPPLVSTIIGSSLDTLVFFSLAFSQAAIVIGPGDSFASEAAPLLGLFALEAPRWLSWALGDLSVKLLVGLAMLAPYGALIPVLAPQPRT
ncbi:queuosine precursor transporter [Hoeflea sp. G2-23]|uniref:Probable queuosine precursor transporter n=1 Tax=Hoeflea algicola TaxID=2983763 RepID=A0ABT3ZAB1_9HYPH|nr:queuosine precursor transporter [Hoeflea algicola]MCY0148715.1 queuosine precursor transporter [Hoeflea algicola]